LIIVDAICGIKSSIATLRFLLPMQLFDNGYKSTNGQILPAEKGNGYKNERAPVNVNGFFVIPMKTLNGVQGKFNFKIDKVKRLVCTLEQT
jgi:hypothetical protein